MRSFRFANCNIHLGVGDDLEATVEAAARGTTALKR